MEAQIFIPELKKQYILSNDVEILLYPLDDGLNYKTENLEHYLLYGKINKKGEYKLISNREVCKYNNEMLSQWQNNKFSSFFLVCPDESKHPLLKKSLEFINYPEAALAITDAEVYVEKDEYINRVNDTFYIFAKKGIVDKSEWLNLAKKIFSSIDEVKEKLNLYNTQTNNYYNKLYQSAINIGSDFSKIINGKIPTKYTIKKDSKFKILKLSYKDNRNFKTKIPFSLVEINGEELILKTEELSKFSLQI